MLADSKLPTMFWTEAINTACYVLNRILITRPHNKTPYELLTGKVPTIGYFKPFGSHVTILNTSDHLGKFEGKADERYIVSYSAHSKAYRVYNLSAKRIEETLNLRFLEDKPNVQGAGHEWYFDLDYLTDHLGYTRFKANQSAGTQDSQADNAGASDDDSDSECDEQVIVVPSYPTNHFSGTKLKDSSGMTEANTSYAEELAKLQRQEHEAKDAAEKFGFEFSKDTEELLRQAAIEARRNMDAAGNGSVPAGSVPVPTDIVSADATHSAGSVPTDDSSVPAAHSTTPSVDSLGFNKSPTRFPSPSNLANEQSSNSELEGIHHQSRTYIFTSSSYDDEFAPTITNLPTSVDVSPHMTKRIIIVHPQSLIIGDPTSSV